MSLIVVKNLSKIYKNSGDLQVLKQVNLEVNKGEMVAIVGPSGAGKSTLLHIIGTLEQADSGSVTIDGMDIKNMNAHQLAAFRNKKIGFVFQFHHLLPEFTALENVCIPGYIAKHDPSQVKARATELLSMLGLQERMHHKPSQLSGGEQQRTAVARALMNNPAVILADEPSGNLDIKNATDLHQLFIQLKKETGQTFVIVTHNSDLAAMADRTLTMKDGNFVDAMAIV